MQVIALPAQLIESQLPKTIDLVAINQALRDRRATLDWTAVVAASDTALATLLAGLDLANDADVIGIDQATGSLSDLMIERLIAHFNRSALASTAAAIAPESIPPASPPAEPIDPQPLDSEPLDSQPLDPQPTVAANGHSPLPPVPSILHAPTAAQLRDVLETAILKELHGPAGGAEEEVDETRITERYLVGVLAPKIRNQSGDCEPEQQDEIAIADKGNSEEGSTESNIPTADRMFPSSIGMTFCVSHTASALEITATWGRYDRIQSTQTLTEKGNPKTVWKRTPLSGTVIQPLRPNSTIDQIPVPDAAPSVTLKGQIRQLSDGDWMVTVFLVNGQTEPSQAKDSAWLFQPVITVRSAAAPTPAIFLKKPLANHAERLDPVIQAENQTMAMQYRHQVEFAVGHGVGVHAELEPNNPTRAIALHTAVVPTYEVPASKPPTVAEIPELAGLVLDMKHLAELTAAELRTALQPLTTAYTSWIEQQAQRLTDPSTGLLPYQDVAAAALSKCRTVLQRIAAGITTLETNPHAAEAFRFMNRAMYLQRIHSLYAERQRRGDTLTLNDIDLPTNRSWYPFQLAFILLNLPSTVDLHHPDRSHPQNAIADLLWFPTGGGKTEAYLGLTAFAIGLRRLQGSIAGRDGGHGVAVLMRYTLRLLTLQQFQRATALICACETIRRENPSQWGAEPFRIGLWVGMKNTPNTTAASEEAAKQYRDAGKPRPRGSGSPHQLTNCPWCGSKINPGSHIRVDRFEKGTGRTSIKCGDNLATCAFSKGEGLPVVVVDEEIYRRLPTLLIATVDKFAQMPWKGEVQMLFGQVNGYCQRHGFRSPDLEDSDRHNRTDTLPAAKTIPHPKLRPPDLIIQDELHLISGPLGTLVGLYETAVDHLCTWEVDGQAVRPKVIASTATIRQAESQVHNLFLRQLSVFPPQGLDIADNFFSRQRDTDPTSSTYSPGRRYVGICAPGRRLKAVMIRVYLAVLSSAQMLYEQYGKEADPWMTLVGYFNSLRELGGTRRLVDDDIRTRLRRMAERGLANRTLSAVDELTSRKDSTEIPPILDRLETPFDPELIAENKARRTAKQKVERPDPLDIILATNMISVGVDVRRLGAMVVCGQPKNTAEYIQATSRVGRTFPGLVLTVYNWARPRDLSHYERFEHYHSTFYQHVEALSVTPFASGARYRGLSAVLAALVRLSGEEFNGNDKAAMIERNHPYVKAAVEAIAHRAELIGTAQTGQQTRHELEVKIDNWLSRIEGQRGGARLKYQITSRDGTTVALLTQPGQTNWEDFTCLNSLRNVEPTINLVFTDKPPLDDESRVPQPYTENP